MASVSGQATTYNLPNYVGELFQLSPLETPFLSMAGGLTGGKSISSKHFTWQTTDLANAAQPNGILEGADPTYAERDRTEVSNVTQIFQNGVEVSYTKRGATGNVSNAVGLLGTQPVQDELAHQIDLMVKATARDVEYSFLNGTYQAPSDNNTGRKTRGIFAAISTNEVPAAGAVFSKSHLDELLLEMFNSGAPFSNAVIFANGFQKQKISDAYGYAPESRTVGGLNISQIETDFGPLGVVIDRHVPTDDILVADMSVINPCFLPIPEKGHFFVEPLAHTGASWKYQLYGEIGLEYGPEKWHGKITGLAVSD